MERTKRIIKRVLAVVLCVCLFLTSAFCFSVSAGAVGAGSIIKAAKTIYAFYNNICDFFEACETIGKAAEALGITRTYTDTDRLECLTSWKSIVDNLSLSESELRSYMSALSAETYYWMFADTKHSLDDICDYIYRREDGTTDSLFTAVNNFAVFYDLSESDLRAFYDIVYNHRTEVYDFCVYTQKCGLTVDMVVDWCFNVDDTTVDVNDSGDVIVSAGVFADYCSTYDYNDRYGPKSTAEYISWRTDERITTGTSYSYIPLSFRADGCFCGNDSWVTDVYLVPFYVTDGIYYYGTYQYHYYVYFDKDEDGNYILDDNGRRVGYIKCDYYNMTVEDSPVNTVVITDDYYGYPYMDIGTVNGNGCLTSRLYVSLTNYLKQSFTGETISAKLISSISLTEYVSDDFTVLVDVSKTSGSGCRCSYVGRDPSNHDANCDKLCDIGYYCSNKPIKMELDIDWSKFAEDDVVTLSGDTIYDCVITNNNGDTSTINEYITNNYTYITNNNGGGDGSGSGGSSSGGTVGGNVTVGGNIDVGGAVDVNVNVNGGSGSDGSMPVNVDLDNYLEQTPEQAQPITQFISIFFDFLPPELLGLICLGVTVAIILRIWGR